MIGWPNIGVLIVSSVLFTLCNVRSVSPAALARRISDSAYPRCATYPVMAPRAPSVHLHTTPPSPHVVSSLHRMTFWSYGCTTSN